MNSDGLKQKFTNSYLIRLPMRFLFSLICTCFIAFIGHAQSGCTDPQASNFDSGAMTNDGSCLYPATAYSLTQLTVLPSTIIESSGLSFFNNNLWTHNDGGNPDKIYKIDTLNGSILQEVIIATADNIDWEDMAENDTHIFVGDFGNNPGNRTDLAIHRIDKNALTSNIVNSEVINFSYSDQTAFPELPNNNNFDCEAFIIHNDVIHLFSKNWVDEKTKHYILPNTPGTHVAQLQSEFDVQGLITSAAIDEEDHVVLVGYTPGGISFMWLLFDFEGNDIFSGNKRYISLGSAINTSQMEGVCFKSTGYGYISSERFATLDAKLFSFDINPYLNNIIISTSNISTDQEIDFFPNPFNSELQIRFPENIPSAFKISIYNSNGQLVFEESIVESGISSTLTLEVPLLTRGYYILNIEGVGFSVSRKIMKR